MIDVQVIIQGENRRVHAQVGSELAFVAKGKRTHLGMLSICTYHEIEASWCMLPELHLYSTFLFRNGCNGIVPKIGDSLFGMVVQDVTEIAPHHLYVYPS